MIEQRQLRCLIDGEVEVMELSNGWFSVSLTPGATDGILVTFEELRSVFAVCGEMLHLVEEE